MDCHHTTTVLQARIFLKWRESGTSSSTLCTPCFHTLHLETQFGGVKLHLYGKGLKDYGKACWSTLPNNVEGSKTTLHLDLLSEYRGHGQYFKSRCRQLTVTKKYVAFYCHCMMVSFGVWRECFSFVKHHIELFVFDVQVVDYYARKGVVAQLPAEKPPKEVTVEVQKVLSS